MVANYEVRILDDNGDVAAVLDTVALDTLRYKRALNGVGTCQITLSADDSRAGLLEKDTLISVTRFLDETQTDEGTYLIRYLRRFEDEDGLTYLIASGFSLEYLLLQRVIDPRNDPNYAGGFSTKQDAADTVMVELVKEQAGALAATIQQVPYLAVATAAGTGDTVGIRVAWKGLLDQLQELAESGGVDFWIERSSGVNLQFVTGQAGSDKTKTTNYPGGAFVLFTPDFGNMARPNLERDWRKEKTHAYLLGQGEASGGVREVYEQLSGALSESRYSYASVVTDARQVAGGDATQYITQARAVLNKNRASTKFAFTVTQAATQYRQVWDLGDRVSVAWNEYEADMRITAVEIAVTQAGETITPTLEVLS